MSEKKDDKKLLKIPSVKKFTKTVLENEGLLKSSEEKTPPTVKEQRQMLCENLSFSAAEAYKLLRTNLLFSIPNEKGGRVIGVTSSTRGEGKTTNSINLSYTLAETGAKVLLIDGDMRLPNVAKRLSLDGKVGLSGLLAGLYDHNKAIQPSGILSSFMIMTSGTLPPNPAELLGSERMRLAVEKLRNQFDFVVIDLPPVNIVTDALIVSNLVDGMIVMVRQDYTDQRSLGDCMKSLELVGAHVLGFVMGDAQEEGGKYGRYKYRYSKRYGKYYKKYGKYGRYSRYGRYGKYGSYYSKYGYNSTYGYGYSYGYAAAVKKREAEKNASQQTAQQQTNENTQKK